MPSFNRDSGYFNRSEFSDKYSDGSGFNDDYRGFRESSLEKGYRVVDGIDWTIIYNDVGELRSKVMLVYWESLLDSPFGTVRVTERLYILQDWYRLGYLIVIN